MIFQFRDSGIQNYKDFIFNDSYLIYILNFNVNNLKTDHIVDCSVPQTTLYIRPKILPFTNTDYTILFIIIIIEITL